MLERIFSPAPFLTARGALDGMAARHAALSDNIANVNTPGYKRKAVPFEQALAHAVEERLSPCTGAPVGPYGPFTPPVVRDSRGPARADGNNVDIEMEMAQLAENAIRYETMVQYVGSYFSGLKTVINGGR